MSGRPQGLQDPRPAVADIDVAVQVPGCRSGADQLQRGLFSAADQGGGRSRKPIADHLHDEAYEVQKYCSMTGHTWDGYWILANRRAWEKLPEDMRAVVIREVTAPRSSSGKTSPS